ncbi:unnamed protein product [Paramecium sonneborni]|uniref:Uncharacterized protein n=1 Tax=Paramecium sonneborni TaxID=65129 RepID=A0A8S1RDN8_9CILI|nr:unnamed protein product [Paramecium sonneborni]
MDNQLEDELLRRMKQSKYSLSFLNHRSIEKIENGYIGFQITRGLWCQLRVFLLQKEGENKNFEMIFSEAFFGEQGAYDKIHEIFQKYKQQQC